MMRAGLLNKQIKILSLVITKNQYGAETTTYEEKIQCRCRVTDFGGGRTTQNSEVFYPYTKQFTVRRYQEIDDFDVIEYENKRYRIISIETDQIENKKVIIGELINE